MIGVISSIIAGFMLKSYFMLSAPLVYLLSRKSRDFGILAYLLYTLYIAKQIVSTSVYSYDGLINSLVFALSSILLLNDVLEREVHLKKLEILTGALMLIGILVPEAFLAGAIFYFFVKFRLDVSILSLLLSIMLLFALLKSQLDFLGGTSNQIIILVSFGLFAIVLTLFKRNLKRANMFREI